MSDHDMVKFNTSLIRGSLSCNDATDEQSNDLCLSFPSLSDMGDGLSDMERFSFLGEGLPDICEGFSDMSEDCYLSPTCSVHDHVTPIQIHCDSDSGIDTQNAVILHQQAIQSPQLSGNSLNLADINPNNDGANNKSNPGNIDNLTVPGVRLRPRKLGLLTPPLSEDIDEEFELWDSPEPDCDEYTVEVTAAEMSEKLDAQSPQEYRQNPRRLPHQPYSEPVVLIEHNPNSIISTGVVRNQSPGSVSERGHSFTQKLDLLDFTPNPTFSSSQDRPMVIPNHEDHKYYVSNSCDSRCEHAQCQAFTNSDNKKRRRILWNTDDKFRKQHTEDGLNISDASFV